MGVRRNLVANYLGSVWVALMGFVFVPFYLKFIGAEGYGLVGFFVMLTAVFAMLDGGLGAAATRESARYGAADEEKRAEIVTLLTTMEIVFWGGALIVGLGIASCATLLADHWLNVSAEMREDTLVALRWMALAVAMQFPLAFYSGCLNGLQRQVSLNVISVVGATARSGGAVLVLWKISPTVDTYFLWHVVISAFLVLAHRLLLTVSIRKDSAKAHFVWSSLRGLRKFLGGVGAINILSLLLTQIDKIILSKVLSLSEFGYYSLAWTLGTIIYRVTGPIFNAYYPKIVQDVQRKDHQALAATYRTSWTLISLVVVPFSLWLAIFGKEILLFWTHSEQISNAASGALALISLGSMCNAFMHMPYAVQLAHGFTRLALWQNMLTLLIVGPLTWMLATNYGLTAAAFPWLLVNASYILISPCFMHRALSLGGMKEWYCWGVLLPVVISASIVIGGSFLWTPDHQQSVKTVVLMMMVLGAAFLANLAIALPWLRGRN